MLLLPCFAATTQATTFSLGHNRFLCCSRLIILVLLWLGGIEAYAQKGGGGGKGGGKNGGGTSGPLLPEDYQHLDLDERMLLAELSLRAVAWLTNGSFSQQSPEQIAPFFGHASEPEEDGRKGGKDEQKDERVPSPKQNDPLSSLRESLELTPGLILASLLNQTQKDMLARGLDERAKRLPDYSSRQAEMVGMLGSVRSQGAAAGASWNLQKLRTTGAEIGRAETNVALIEARVMTVLLESLEPLQKAFWRRLQQNGLERLNEAELKQLAAARQGLAAEALPLLERAALWSEKDRRDVVTSPLTYVGDYFGDLAPLQPRKQGGGSGKKPKGDEEKRMGAVGAFLGLLDRAQRHLMLDLLKTQARLVSDYQSRHAQIASAMLSIRHGAKVEMSALGSSAGELGALETQMAAEQGAAFLEIASSFTPAQLAELGRASEEAARQSKKKP